ncbi:Hypothetical protein SRAE_2000167500 [Strongyloides ratti]|uniref:Uncharacterized protein n=1 Tax=Strongyloides ratti TaxID=34506 RepID=A0A090LHL8_STRRB|nr:Hypothetical protein SRAE_2000167500 [Strongyloides ratti]CEF67010.1 Hypothetical protein SRAE_2000167500 [Strongyloides ratti]
MNSQNSRNSNVNEFNKSFQSSSFKRKLLYYLKFQNHSIIGKISLCLAGYLIFFNTTMYFWKKPDYPINNFMWRIKKANGTLSKECLEKERILGEFHKSKITKNDDSKRPWFSSIYE